MSVRESCELATAMAEGIGPLLEALAQWALQERRSLSEIEEEVSRAGRQMLQGVAESLCERQQERYPSAVVTCDCGKQARYERRRKMTCQTILGPLQLRRAYYLCRHCGQGQSPLDQQLEVCPGSISAELDARLADLGCRLPFEEGAEVLEQLTGVAVSANRVRKSTERLGQVIEEQEQEEVEAAWDVKLPPPAGSESGPETLYIEMDGTMVNTREDGWREMKVASIHELDAQTQECHASYRVHLGSPEPFGRRVWLEAHRRGLNHARRVVALGDGAAWIWKLVDEHFSEAVQIVDWYHATQYIHAAARDCFGEDSTEGKAWAKACKDRLWEGRVDLVIRRMAYRASRSEAADQACTYFRNNCHRMDYPAYRDAGFQIGSGVVESSCKQVVGARLKLAGMRWNVAEAQRVAKARAAQRGGDWSRALTLRPTPQRLYRRPAA
jgi:hypothetical protein